MWAAGTATVLVTGNNLAATYGAVGRAAEAIPLHERTLAACERVLGPDHPDTLQLQNNRVAARRAVDLAD